MSAVNSQVRCGGYTVDATAFQRALVMWGDRHGRSFPWRVTGDPYRILMAEVMLHRTQARQVVPVYHEFLGAHPNPQSVAKATRREVHQALHSLGLRWRIDLVQELALDLVDRFDGQVPQGKEELLSLPGVSQYIASAVRCFAWNFPEPLLDANTVRVIGRLFQLQVKDSSRRNPTFRRLASRLVDTDDPRRYNYALLDLAHAVCLARRPARCEECPVYAHCAQAQSVVVSCHEGEGRDERSG